MGNIAAKHNRLTHTTSYYTFNARNQLTHYEQKDENNQTVKTLEFSYDALGRRVSKTEDGITQKYLYDGDDIVAILDTDNNVIATLTHDESIDTPLSITNANGTFYYHRDHQGSIIALTDSSGQVVERFTYDNHYGTVLSHTKTIETNNPYAYTGREFDTPELYYYRARYYDPTLQRFISEDPIGFASGDFNWYRYVGDDPVDWVDPWGLENFDPLTGIPISLMQPIYKWFDRVFGEKPPTKFDKFVDGTKQFAKGFELIPNKMFPEGKRAYDNAPRAAQMCLDVSFTVVEFGFTKPLPYYITVPYDIYSGANFVTIPTSPAGIVGNLLFTPLQ